DAVQLAKDFAANRNDTLIIVVPDHAHPISLIGTYDDAAGSTLRERLQTYAAAQFPNYAPADGEGYLPQSRSRAAWRSCLPLIPTTAMPADPISPARPSSARCRSCQTRLIARQDRL
ncbi:MAG: hypothetical protein ACXWJU_08395, partial [Hyphomicrobium sp.]